MKKWSYATALMLSLAGGGMLTGCIDNDEPYGIKEVRLATASFLESQKTLTEAKAAAEKAKAELDKINAEIAKINAEIAKAQAESAIKIAEAEAEAKLAKTKAEAEEAQARADMEKAKVEAYINGRKAELDRYIGETQNAINWANLEYEKALYAWEQQKVQDAEWRTDALYVAVAGAYDSYLDELEEFNTLNDKLLAAQRKYAQYANDLEWNPNTGQFENANAYKQKEILEDQIESYQFTVDMYQKTLDAYTEFGKKLDNITKSELYTLLQDYKAKREGLVQQYAEAQVEYSEIELKNQPLKEEVDKLQAEYQKIASDPIAIAAYTFKPSAELAKIGMTEQEIVPENITYSLADPQNYNKYIGIYESQIDRMQNYLYDENDIAWTNARVNEMQRDLQSKETAFNSAKSAWELAKTVYNMGNEPKASALPNAAEIDKAIADYVAAGAALEPLIADYKAKAEAEGKALAANKKAKTDYNTALEKYNASKSPAQQKYEKAYAEYEAAKTAADTKRNTAKGDAEIARDKANAAADVAYKTTENELSVAQKNLNVANAELELNPNDAKLKEAQKTANDKYVAAYTKFYGAEAEGNKPAVKSAETVKAEAKAANQATYVKACNKADVEYDKAEAAAYETLKKAENEFLAAGGYDAPKDNSELTAAAKKATDALNAYTAAQEATQDAKKALEKPQQAVRTAYDAIDKQIKVQETKINYTWSDKTNYNSAYDGIENFVNGVENATLPTIIAPALVIGSDSEYTNVKKYLIAKSQAAYGNLGFDQMNDQYNNNSTLEVDEAFLVEADKIDDAFLNEFVKKYYKKWCDLELQDYQCYKYYGDLFGAFGAQQYTKNRIEVAKAMLSQSDMYTNLIDTFNANIAAIEKSKKDAEVAQDAAFDVYEAKSKEYYALFEEANNKMIAIYNEVKMVDNVITTINSNFPYTNDQDLTPEMVDQMIKVNAQNIEQVQQLITDAQEALDHAKYNLAQYENGKAEYDFNPYESEVNLLKSQIEVAKAELEFHKAQLDELQARYEASTKKAE